MISWRLVEGCVLYPLKRPHLGYRVHASRHPPLADEQTSALDGSYIVPAYPRSPFWTLASLTVLEGVRQRFWLALGGVLLVGLLLAGFASFLAVTEARQIFSALLGAFLRLAAVLLIGLHVLSSQTRSHQDKVLELLFSLPVSRGVCFFGTLAGYALLVFFVVLLFCGTLLFFVPFAQVILWGGSLFLELLIVAVFSFLAQLTVRQVPAAFLVVLFFYLLSRTMTSLQWVGQGAIMPHDSVHLPVINAMLNAMAFILPGLDRFTQSEWLAYGQGGWEDFLFVIVQGVSYLVLLCGAVLIDLYRKDP